MSGPAPFDPGTYAEAAAAAMDLPLPGHARDGVVKALAQLAAMAAPLLAFPLPPDANGGPQA